MSSSSAPRDDPDSLILEQDELTLDALTKLFGDEILAIIVPRFASMEFIDKARGVYAAKPLEDYRYFDQPSQTYKNLGVKRSGIPYNTTYQDDQDSLDLYYEQAPASIWKMREEFSPYLNPLDHLRLVLDELWPQGASVANHNGRKNFVGMYREVSAADSAALEAPHFDLLPSHKGDVFQQFAANVYVDVPHEGGELMLWATKQIDREDLRGGYQDSPAFRQLVERPSIKIVPKSGMLALFCAQKPHAIAGFKGSKRSSLQCFIGLETTRHLALWN